MTLTALPYPVSRSAMTGTDTRSTIARVMSRCWLNDKRLASGTPQAADNSNPLAQIPSKPASSARRADSGLCADITLASLPGPSQIAQPGRHFVTSDLVAPMLAAGFNSALNRTLDVDRELRH